MKKIIITFFTVMLVSSFSSAQESAQVKKDFEVRNPEARTITGIIKTVMPADLSRPNTIIIMTDEGGADVVLTLKPTAVIFNGSDGAILSVREIAAGAKIRANYNETVDGIYKVSAIKLISDTVERLSDPQMPAPVRADEEPEESVK